MHYIRSVVLSMLLVGLVGCSTILPPSHEKITTPAAQSDTVTEEEGTPSIQEAPVLTPVTDSSMGSTSLGGAVEQSMDQADKTKMMRAMDKAPGKSTQWTNTHSQVTYTVTPTKKVHIEDKSFCRQYQMTALDSNNKERTAEGIACVASDGNWHILRE